MGTEDTWGEIFEIFCTQAARATDLEDHCALLYTLEKLTRTKEDARRLIRTARRAIFGLEYAMKWAEQLITENEDERPWN